MCTGSIPSPSSVTLTSSAGPRKPAVSSLRRSDTMTVLAPYLTAFSTRLVKTCDNWSGSAGKSAGADLLAHPAFQKRLGGLPQVEIRVQLSAQAFDACSSPIIRYAYASRVSLGISRRTVAELAIPVRAGGHALGFGPDGVYAALDPEVEWFSGPHAVTNALAERGLEPTDLIEREVDELDAILADLDVGSRLDRERVLLLIRLYRLLSTKYSNSPEGLLEALDSSPMVSAETCVAVLPFRYRGVSEHDYLGEGIAEELQNARRQLEEADQLQADFQQFLALDGDFGNPFFLDHGEKFRVADIGFLLGLLIKKIV